MELTVAKSVGTWVILLVCAGLLGGVVWGQAAAPGRRKVD